MNKTDDLMQPCKGGMCDFALHVASENTFCQSGGSSCMAGQLLEAHTSGFHDGNLARATKQINQILSNIPKDENGRKLSFFVTRLGILLAWANHDDKAPTDVVTAKDKNEVLTKALRLKRRRITKDKSLL
jgi:hypothetical protein